MKMISFFPGFLMVPISMSAVHPGLGRIFVFVMILKISKLKALIVMPLIIAGEGSTGYKVIGVAQLNALAQLRYGRRPGDGLT